MLQLSVLAKPFNELENTAISTMVAIMGRISAYTGKETTYEEMMNSDLKLGPQYLHLVLLIFPKKFRLPDLLMMRSEAARAGERSSKS